MSATEPYTDRDLRQEWGWANGPGNTYFHEKHDTRHRRKFWMQLIDRYTVKTALEVGCGKGDNLLYLSELGIKCTGIDINEGALEQVSEGIETHCCSATELPFKDKSFDLVLTSGVLLHAPPAELPLQMAEIARCARRYVFALEYAAEEGEEMVRPWRWMENEGIWHRDYGEIYERDYGMKLLETGTQDEGTWLGVTWWMLSR